MKVLIFGATGMVGQGVLRESLLDPEVTQVLSLGRRPTGIQHPKLREIIHTDLYDYSNIESELTGVDACFYCLGVSSVGMKEADYARISYDMTLAAAQVLARLNPNMVFTYVSGAGTDSTEKGAVMWARVKGKTENALLRLPLRAYMFRPGIIQPLHGVRSKTRLYQFFYTLAAPLFPIFRAIFPHQITTTEQVGKAMLIVARRGSDKKLLESKDIVTLR
ncbi:MAG: NAD-dependent epimerase/dehydratase family protein [Burkholderiaceae bacterium]|uniref:NAD-dependent epimerase/dehydratase family protein n=1 Tax=Herminiimonas contaminans TaxID=1111140 RepID=A0ABS0EVR1_9BURK|nr:NAD-dependent epimerase/dehydratase family protein [Herminiimonas contaminans]MBF8178850.1 NAD-dependent epimerase/dehydratase family protein [Herminiimonas contaminans]MBX9798374.1 NAD-dependent epimerase/dehydratase family protein [Burkholderiaceae bacterium]